MINLNSKIAGWYKIEAGKKDGSRRVLADWFPNLITNSGLDRIGNNADYLSYCHVGAGSTAPAFTDTGLVSWIAQTGSKVSTTSTQGTSPYYSTQKFVYSFGMGVAAGNLSEVGVGWNYTNTNFFSRALILDTLGSPTTITVLADEYLYVTYQLRRYIPEVDTSSVVTIAGVDYTFIGRASSAGNSGVWGAYFAVGAGTYLTIAYNGVIGVITSYPSGTLNSITYTVSFSTYTIGNYYRDLTATFSLTQGNVGGISALLIQEVGGTQIQFGVTPDIPKTVDDILTLTFRYSWSRH